jgi:hypothetical protein
MKLTVKVRRAEPYSKEDGKQPYNEWLWKLKDLRGKARVAARVDRAARGNFGIYILVFLNLKKISGQVIVSTLASMAMKSSSYWQVATKDLKIATS